MSGYEKYREKRSSWGIGALGSLVVEIETEDGTIGVATGSGGVPAAWMIKNHFARFVVGQDARNINMIWDQLYRVLAALCAQGPADHGDQRRRPRALGSRRQGARRSRSTISSAA